MNLTTPPGVNSPSKHDRMPLYKAICGDDWTLDFSLFDPVSKQPATMINTIVDMILTDNRFSYNTYWHGSWGHGILPDERLPGLVHVIIPKAVTSRLRRGVYTYSIRVTDIDTQAVTTTNVGYIQVEYEATSPQHNIPYRTYRTKTSKDATQYVTGEELSKAVADAVNDSRVYSDWITKQLLDILVEGAEESPTLEDMTNLLEKLKDNLKNADVES